MDFTGKDTLNQQTTQQLLELEKKIDSATEREEVVNRLSKKIEKLEKLRQSTREHQKSAQRWKNFVGDPQLSDYELCRLGEILTLYDERLEHLRTLKRRAEDHLKCYREKNNQSSLTGTVSGILKVSQHLVAPMSELGAEAVGVFAHGSAACAKYLEYSAEDLLSKQVAKLIQEVNECLNDCKGLKHKFDRKRFGQKANIECLSPVNEIMAMNGHEATPSPLSKTIKSEDFEKAVCSAKKCANTLLAKGSSESEDEHITWKTSFNGLDHVALSQAVGETLSAVGRFDRIDLESSLNHVCMQISHFLDVLKDERDYLQKTYRSLKPQ